jgi:enterochelin esterase-like enzyme
MFLPHVENIYTLAAIGLSGVFHWLTARAQKNRSLTIMMQVNGRLSETLLRNEQLAHELSKAEIPIPPPMTPVIRTIVVRDPNAGNS